MVLTPTIVFWGLIGGVESGAGIIPPNVTVQALGRLFLL